MTDNMELWNKLAAEFPRSAVSWRAQNIKKDGSSAMALAYIDARDVMERLDSVIGPAAWSDSYEVHEHVTICTISIQAGEWVSKADGAGDTDVEAEKGRISDAFKRAAVKWGIGRYLYSIAAPWVECETYDTGKKDNFGNTKWGFKRWKEDPWSKVKPAAPVPSKPLPPHDPVTGEVKEEPPIPISRIDGRPHYDALAKGLSECETLKQLQGYWERNAPIIKTLQLDWQLNLKEHKDQLKDDFLAKQAATP